MLKVVAALIVSEDRRRFLLCQRPVHKARGGLWEFPGGKVEPGETAEQALERECLEELGIQIQVEAPVISVSHEYPELTVHLTLLESRIRSGNITLLEHQDAQWITRRELSRFTLCPADGEMVQMIFDRLPE